MFDLVCVGELAFGSFAIWPFRDESASMDSWGGGVITL